MKNNKIIEVKNLQKRFKNKVVFRNLSFDVYAGDFFGIIGPNGVGKTVLLHILLGIILPEEGQIRIFDKNLFSNLKFIRKKINYASPYDNLYQQATLLDNLRTFADLYNVENKETKIDKIVKMLNLQEIADNQLIELFSDGMRAKAILAKALISEPEILLLDEPMASLDVDAQKKLSKYLIFLNKKKKVTILFSSHNFSQIRNFCNRVMDIANSKIIFNGKNNKLKKNDVI